MFRRLKKLARRSLPLIVGYKIFNNWRLKRHFASGRIETIHGSTHSKKTLSESLTYIDEQFQDYLVYSGLPVEQFRGKRILELGFGDNVGVALRFLAAGVSRTVCVDKFYAKRDLTHERQIYCALRDRLTLEEKHRFDEAVSLTDGIELNNHRLMAINGLSVEEAAEKLRADGENFDFIISRAVIEEIYEPNSVLLAADRLLTPGGLMMHKIDLSDYGIFHDGGMHPLTFLTIPERIYRLMASDSGLPNRKLIGYYRQMMCDLGYDTKFYVSSIIGTGPITPHLEQVDMETEYSKLALSLISEIRPKLCREYRSLSEYELMADGVFLRARKPLEK